MNIYKYHGSYNIQPRTSTIKYIVIHYTGSGTSKSGSAKANCIYFSNGDRQASAHYFIDDGGIWEYANPKSYVTWHCGDGHGAYGITNANSIGIEVCINGDKEYTAKEIGYLKQLVPYLMKTYGVSASHVVRHYDASRKMCPYYYAKRQSAWETLRKIITASASTSTKKTSKTKKKTTLEVDGNFGVASVKRAQQFFGTSIDGVISGQNTSMKGYLTGISNNAIEYGGKGGSSMVKALQKWVGAAVTGTLNIDTIKKLQKKIGAEADGSWGKETSKKFQTYLNKH